MTLKYVGLAIISAVCMASSGIIAKYSQIAAAELTFYRLFVGALCLGLLLLLQGKTDFLKKPPSKRQCLNGILLATFMLAFLQAITTISLAHAIMLVYLAPPLTAVIAHLVFAERLTKRSFSLVVLSLVGFALLQQFSFTLSVTELWPISAGFGFGLLSLLAYSAYLLCNRQPESAPIYQRTFYQLGIGACCVVPFMTDFSWPEGQQLPWILSAGIVPGFIAILTAVTALQHLPTRVYGALAYIEPVVVILAGWLLFQQQLTFMQLFGAGLILICGISQAALSKPQQQKPC